MEPSTLHSLPIDIVLNTDWIGIFLNYAKSWILMGLVSFWIMQRNPEVRLEGGPWGPNPITACIDRKWIYIASEANSPMEQMDLVTGPGCCWLIARGGKLKLTKIWSWSLNQLRNPPMRWPVKRLLATVPLHRYPLERIWVGWIGFV